MYEILDNINVYMNVGEETDLKKIRECFSDEEA